MGNSEKTLDKADVKTNKDVPKTENTKEKEKSKEAKEAAAETTVDDEEDEELSTAELFNRRQSVPLTPENARFSHSAGNLIALELTKENGETEYFERVIIRRSFPITAPEEFLSVREPDTRANGSGSEIGMIRMLSLFDKETIELISHELSVRYFMPEILRITSSHEKYGAQYWELETSAGHISTVLNRPHVNIRELEDHRIFVTDMNGNCFFISDIQNMDRYTRRVLEMYL